MVVFIADDLEFLRPRPPCRAQEHGPNAYRTSKKAMQNGCVTPPHRAPATKDRFVGPKIANPNPKGPKIEKIQELEIFKRDRKFEFFKRAAHQTPILLWGILNVKIEIFNRD